MSNDPLHSVRVKVNRAKHHLIDLEREVTAFLATNPYQVIQDIDPQTGKPINRFRIIRDISNEWAGMVGDVIHNLRASFDNLATALAVHNNASDRILKDTYFPISGSKQLFEKRIGTDLKGVHPDAIRLIKRIKPYSGGTDALWQLHRLDITDKHSALVPVGAAFRQIIMETTFGDRTISLPINAANKQFPLKDGDVIGMTFELLASASTNPAPEQKLKTEHKFAFYIAFGEGQVVDSEPLVPTLKQFVDLVEGIVDTFAREIFGIIT